MKFCDKLTLQSLVELYNDDEIAQHYNVSAIVVQRLRLEYRIMRNRTHTLNEHFFDALDTQDKAYIFGFIAADGHVSKDGKFTTINITEDDRPLLEDIKIAMDSTAPIHIRQPGKGSYANSKPIARLDLCSMYLVKKLNLLGLQHDKSITLTYPDVPASFESHFIRGFFDGNGTITDTYFNVVSTLPFLQGLLAAFQSNVKCNLHLNPHSRSPHVHILRGNGKDAAEAIQWMYHDAHLKLQRKYEKYLSYWETLRT
jgi:hypothetical protein